MNSSKEHFMMEYNELLDLIENKVKKLVYVEGEEENVLREEIKAVLTSEDFVKGPFTDKDGNEVYELIYLQSEGKAERYECGLYENKLNYLLRKNKKGRLAYVENKSGRKFIDFLFYCLKKIRGIDSLAYKWSLLQKEYLKDTDNIAIKSNMEKIAYKICENIFREYNLNINTDDGKFKDIGEEKEIKLEAINEALAEALCANSEKCYSFEKNNSFNAYILFMSRYKLSTVRKERDKNSKKANNQEENVVVVKNYEDISEVEGAIGKKDGIEDEVIDRESGYRIFEALLKVLPIHTVRDLCSENDIIDAEKKLDKKMSIYQSILSYNIVSDIEENKGLGDIRNNGSMDIYMENESRIYLILRKTLVAFLKDGSVEDFDSLYNIIIANIREGINLKQMQKNLQDYFYQYGIAKGKGKPISRQTVGKYIDEFTELINELRI